MRFCIATIGALASVALSALSRSFYAGHDLSTLSMLENADVAPAIFKDTLQNDTVRPLEDILGDGGMNAVRLRLWVNPQYGTYGLNYTIDLAKRMFAKNNSIYLDMFFADSWAAPGNQPVPAAWAGQSFSALKKTLRAYVKNSLVAFHQAGVDLEMVSLGNEIINGMLWPYGQANSRLTSQKQRNANFTQFSQVWKAARLGVTDAVAQGVKQPSVMVHLDGTFGIQNNVERATAWFKSFLASGVVKTTDFDIFGISFYPFYSQAATWGNLSLTFQQFTQTYQKPVMVVETDWPVQCDGKYRPVPNFTQNFTFSTEGQFEWVDGILNVLKAVPNGLGQGIFYWEPAWLNQTSLGSACEDMILFDQDWSGWPNQVVGYSRNSTQMFVGLT